jgi:hypothetical protein
VRVLKTTKKEIAMNVKNCVKGFVVLCVSLMACLAWAGNLPQSKFISGNPQFEPDKDQPGAMIYLKPGLDMSTYTKVLIDPIEIWIAEDSEYKGLDPDELKKLTDTLRQALTKELEPDYPVVNEAGEGVLGIRLAITNVHMKDKKRGLLGYTPIGFVVTTAANMAGMRMELSSATIETEILDGGTTEQVAALIDTFEADTKDKKAEKVSWENVGKRLEFYAKRLRARLDRK